MEEKRTLEVLKTKALTLMEKAGFPLIGTITIEVDKSLPYMGYTTEKNGHPVIVVAGFAVENDMALNLFIHEMSHIYWIQNGHPSHSQQLLLSNVSWIMHGKAVEPYQEKILHTILNTIQDLYADDISFAIFDTKSDLSNFFLGWIHQPVRAKTSQEKWENAEKLINAAFAQANLQRHGVKDVDHKVQKTIDEFLQKIGDPYKGKYQFFKQWMIALPKEVGDKEFEKLLIIYLSEFLRLTN